MTRRKAAVKICTHMPRQLDDARPEPEPADQLEALVAHVADLVTSGQREELRTLLIPLLTRANSEQDGSGGDGSQSTPAVLGTFMGPVAELRAGKNPPILIDLAQPICSGSQPWMLEFRRLVFLLNHDIANRTPFPDSKGVPRPLDELDLEETIRIISDIVQLQLDGRVRLEREAGFTLS